MNEQRLPLVVDGLRLSGGACLPEHPKGALVLLHGIPSIAPPDPDDRGYPGLAHDLAGRGWATAWADMRAVRNSPGFFSIEGWVRDARAIVDAMRSLPGVGSLRLGLVGSSAGGAVAAEVVARGAPVDALVLLAAPAQWSLMAADPASGVQRIVEQAGMALAPEVFADPTAWAAEFERVSAAASISAVRVPTLIVHGTDDIVVPVDHADRIAARAQRAELKIVSGAGHQLRRVPTVVDMVEKWLEGALK